MRFFHVLSVTALVLGSTAWAQMWETPTPASSANQVITLPYQVKVKSSAKGDYVTSVQMGNRGLYSQGLWVVTDPTGLNCRNASMNKVAFFYTGAILRVGTVKTVSYSQTQASESIAWLGNAPWLKVYADEPWNASAVTCYVRANQQYMTPLHYDYLYNAKP